MYPFVCLLVLLVTILQSVYDHFVCTWFGLVIKPPPPLLGCKEISGTKKYSLDKDSMKFWPFTVALTFYTRWWRIIQLNKFSWYDRIKLNHVILTLKTANHSFCMTLWPMMINSHTEFGYKRFLTSEDTVQINMYWNFEPLMWPWFWAQDTLA